MVAATETTSISKKTTKVAEAKPAKEKAKKESTAKKPASDKVEYKGRNLRSAQVRILKALVKSKTGSLTKTGIEEAANVNPAWTYDMAGRADKAAQDKSEERHNFPCLASLGLLKVKEMARPDDDSGRKETIFEILAAGRKIIS